MATTKATTTLRFEPLTTTLLTPVCALQRLAMASVWSRSHWQNVLGERYCVRVAFDNEVLCGAVVFSTILDEAELETIFIHPAFRRQGVAQALLQEGFKCLPTVVNKVFLEVDTDNSVAIALYRDFYFEVVSERKAYYKNASGNGDALIMMRQQ